MTEKPRAHVCIPWAPSGNTSVRHANGTHYRTAAYKGYRNDVAVRVIAAGLHRHPLVGRLKVTMHACPPDKRVRDLDNQSKTICDSLVAAGMFADDSQIDDLRILRLPVDEKGIGYVNVFVEVM